jgi:multiple sugar transport system permease protein
MSALAAPELTVARRAPVQFHSGRFVKVGLVAAIMTVIALFVVLPVVWLVLATTKDNRQLFSMGAFSVPSDISLGSNLSHAFSIDGGVLAYWLLNSVGYAVVISVGSTYLATLAGYAVAKLKFPGRRVFTATIVGSLMVPSAVLVIPLYVLEQRLRIVNSYEGVVFPLLLSTFAVFFMMVYLGEALPDVLIEAAQVDGAGHWRIFHRIALPIARPGLATLVLISFIATWNNYFLPYVLLSNQKLFPLTVGLDYWLGTVTGSASAGAGQVVYPDIIIGTAVAVLPTLLLFAFLSRYVVRGLSLGAVAGE